MPSFSTPRPIAVVIDLAFADIHILAGERSDTSVEIRPRYAARAGDIRAAEMTTVDFAADRLSIRGPRAKLFVMGLGRREAVDVTIALPAGSHLDGDIMAGRVRVEGRLGTCRLKIGDGQVTLDETATLNIGTGRGDIAIGTVSDRADITTGMGSIRIERLRGPASLKNSYGRTEIGTAAGGLRIHAASGNIVIGEAEGDVVAKTAYGDVRIESVVRGAVQADTAYGQLDLGIRAGTAAWVEAHTSLGRVTNALDAHDGAPPSTERAEIRARTAYGDITIRRSHASAGMRGAA